MEASKKTLGYGPKSAIVGTIGSYVGSNVIASLFITLLVPLTGWKAERVNEWFDASVAAQAFVTFMVASAMIGLLTLFLWRRKTSWASLGLVWPKWRQDMTYALVGYAVYFVAFIFISQLAVALFPGLNLEQEQDLLFDKATTGSGLWFVFISLVVLPPIVEEMAFRGFLYSGLRTKWSFWPSAIITSLLFAILHLQLGSGNALLWVAALDTAILSIILVQLREKTGRLAAPMLVHFMKNSLAFTFLFLLRI